MKLAIITGGSRGLGSALVQMLKSDGYAIKELSRSGRTADSITVDLAAPDQLSNAVSGQFKELATLAWEEILFFNNAGAIFPVGIVSNSSIDEVMENININYTSAILLIREFIQAFQASTCPKTIVNISSGAAVSNIYGWSLYCGAKAGIEHFVRGVAAEQKEQPHPIKTLNIGPGIIDTDMQADIRSVSADDFPGVERFRSFKEDGDLRPPGVVAQAIKNILESDQESGSRHNIQDFL